MKDISDNFKNDLTTKSEQLKQKNKTINDFKTKYEKVVEEKRNLTKKVESLQQKNKALSAEVEKVRSDQIKY